MELPNIEGVSKEEIDFVFDSLPGTYAVNQVISKESQRTILELNRISNRRLVYEDKERYEWYEDIEALKRFLKGEI